MNEKVTSTSDIVTALAMLSLNCAVHIAHLTMQAVGRLLAAGNCTLVKMKIHASGCEV